jgi:SAM-dependent methyltransferase
MPFSDGAGYERFMARWSSAVGAIFLDWLAPSRGARWLDIGCGTGAFTKLIVDRCAPATVIAVDPSEAQIAFARNEPVARHADFRVADAQALPFEDGAFDVVVSALVINFVPNRHLALAEMRRVGGPGGGVAGYVWDFMNERTPTSPIRRGLIRIGVNPARVPGAEDSSVEALTSLFAANGLMAVATRTIDVTVSYPDFDSFWRFSTPVSRPIGKTIAALTETDRRRLLDVVRSNLPSGPDGSIAYSARAHAIKARVPE